MENIKVICKCRWCGKPLFKDIRLYKTTYKHLRLYRNEKSRVFPFCCEECKKEFMKQYEVEEYKGNKIYCVDGGYMPYFDCLYYYNSLEECRKRIDEALKDAVGVYV